MQPGAIQTKLRTASRGLRIYSQQAPSLFSVAFQFQLSLANDWVGCRRQSGTYPAIHLLGLTQTARMGYSMSWAAVKGSTPQAVRDTLVLRATGAREEIPESDITAVELPGGWYMVVSDRDGLHLTSDEVLARLSALGEVIACYVEEHVMFSSAECWRRGRRVWSVQHDAQRGMEHLTAEGELPPTFSSVRDELRAKQEAAGGSEADVDYIWDAPVTLAHQLTGWRHDHVIPGLADDAFEVLERTSTKGPKLQSQSTPWWRRLI
jgi:hypothetical protein